ncbi:MAG TPA: hypothetical protein VKQ32_06035 [Polyangia bacterium]|nr:hypothetical protein [Polyangia bacterium]
MKVTRAMALGIVFVIGCAVGGVSSQFIVPPVRAGTNPTRWEYYCLEDTEKLVERSDKLGAQGWEMTAASAVAAHNDPYFVWCFKRPLP